MLPMISFFVDISLNRASVSRWAILILLLGKFWASRISKSSQILHTPNCSTEFIVNIDSSQSEIVNQWVAVVLFMQQLAKLFCDFFTNFLNRSEFLFLFHHWCIKLLLKLFWKSAFDIDFKLIQRLFQVLNQWLNDLVKNLLKFST